ncbi:MAG: DAK2 domain-containing protein [Bacillota bacterium]|nr:DAK2 domain-containing protein [Bacillota bacterium]
MISGDLLRDMYISAANNIENHKASVNDLNVFPVPDGDTGTNMGMTFRCAANDVKKLDGKSAGEVASAAASALLRGARGNSGVIISLIFRGFAKGLLGKETADGADIAGALKMGVEAAYKAVMKPTEGTILTVARVAGEEAVTYAGETSDALLMFDKIIEVAKDTLSKTPDMLPVLKAAGVIDAGGQGLVYILEGMKSVLDNGVIIETQESAAVSDRADFASFNGEDINFAYCTEYIVNKVYNPRFHEPQKLRSYLESIGDSVVVADDDGIIKVHVHTNNPGKALEEGLKYGFLSNMKVENMKEQLAREAQKEESQKETDDGVRRIAQPDKKYGFVAVSAGEGFTDLFHDLGVDGVANGFQTMNPSTEDILKEIDKTPAEVVYVLPNNKNIILTAQMAAPLSEKEVIVIPTTTIPEGIAALLAFDETADVNDNTNNMQAAIKNVKTGEITYAVRDSSFDGQEIKQGQYMGLSGKKMHAIGMDLTKVTDELVAAMLDNNSSILTLFSGKEVESEKAQELADYMTKKYGDRVDVSLVEGGQPVYYYIVSVE